jgi:hypothetical protein
MDRGAVSRDIVLTPIRSEFLNSSVHPLIFLGRVGYGKIQKAESPGSPSRETIRGQFRIPAGPMKKNYPLQLSWRLLLLQTGLAVFGYVFLEWLFFATKPSFMDALPLAKKIELLLLAGLLILLPALAVVLALRILGWIPGPTKTFCVFLWIGALIPAVFTAAISLLLIDNFTYTLWNFGIVTSQGALRAGYAILAAVLLGLWYRQMILNIRRPVLTGAGGRATYTGLQKVQAGILLLLLLAFLGAGVYRFLSQAGTSDGKNVSLQRQPNIILIGGDGMDAANMSLYGYFRPTTPHLDELAKTGLLAENNFTNAAHTTGSVFSMLTGKYPAQTRLLYSPNILQGADAYEHIPGILQRAGYETVQITFPYYIDAYAVNLQEGFDRVNERSIDQGEIFRLARQYHLEDAGYFLPRLWERIADRLLHIFFVREMPDPYRTVLQEVDRNSLQKLSDPERVNQVIHLLETADRPLFIHTHLMDTHGYKFYPRKHVFSAGKEQTQDWMQDFFDDAVLDFDAYVGEIVDALVREDLWDNTILVVYSDHADRWRTDDRIPLLFHFPNGEYAGRIRSNTQDLDVGPTLLDYLGMEIPSWMGGQSLIAGEPASTRPILSAGVIGIDCQPPDWWCEIDQTRVRAPFFQFGTIQVVICQEMYTFTLETRRLVKSPVDGHTTTCPMKDLPSDAQVLELILDHLRTNGFDVSTLE